MKYIAFFMGIMFLALTFGGLVIWKRATLGLGPLSIPTSSLHVNWPLELSLPMKFSAMGRIVREKENLFIEAQFRKGPQSHWFVDRFMIEDPEFKVWDSKCLLEKAELHFIISPEFFDKQALKVTHVQRVEISPNYAVFLDPILPRFGRTIICYETAKYFVKAWRKAQKPYPRTAGNSARQAD